MLFLWCLSRGMGVVDFFYFIDRYIAINSFCING